MMDLQLFASAQSRQDPKLDVHSTLATVQSQSKIKVHQHGRSCGFITKPYGYCSSTHQLRLEPLTRKLCMSTEKFLSLELSCRSHLSPCFSLSLALTTTWTMRAFCQHRIFCGEEFEARWMRGESSNLVLASTSTTPQETHGCYMMLCCQLNFLPDTWASHFCKLHFCKQTAVPSMASDKTRLCQLASRLRAVSACLYQRILSCPIQLALASARSTAARLLASNRPAIRARKNRTLFPVATSEKYDQHANGLCAS